MVKVVVAGVTSQLAREVLEGLMRSGKHELLGLCREITKEVAEWSCSALSLSTTTYEDKQELVRLLKSADILLCFFSPMHDAEGKNQIRLIDAAVEAGVKRYIPSEWFAGAGLATAITDFPYMAGKLAVRKYLEDLNRDKKVIEYTLLSPGMFMDYLAYPRGTDATHTRLFETFINMQEARGFYMEGHEHDSFTLTAITDIVNVVLRAIDYEGEWPVNGGVAGETVTIRQLIELGEKLRVVRHRGARPQGCGGRGPQGHQARPDDPPFHPARAARVLHQGRACRHTPRHRHRRHGGRRRVEPPASGLQVHDGRGAAAQALLE
ncbi:hypothetical protein RB594_000239 [Gaeumannomyces avenae]